MLRAACVVLLLALTGCTGNASSGEEKKPTAASTKAPELGACQLLTPEDINHDSNDSPAVACSEKHTAQTFAVGTFPDAVAAKGVGSSALGAYVFKRCKPAFRKFVGADDSLVLRSTLTWAWFRSSKAAWDAGAHHWRCDVVGGGDKSGTLLSLPGDREGPAARPARTTSGWCASTGPA